MASDYIYVALFAVIGIGFSVVALLLSWAIRPYNPRGEKLSTYECGEKPKGSAWVQLRPGYYIYMLVFVIFDVEVLFVFPWAMALKHLRGTSLAVFAIVDMVIFVGILALGLIYAWRKGVLKWE
ncbi:MAG TPA: NADH-quinone oxidoreductase subunit A [Armatimonadota bacterium]|nr:NADH-quinone oxidoreductase subunit A [Armatimonadota bacterium]HOM70662.1 NADH-quinone oxidoreductase subunit A [Armatimonadota bacterium]